VSSQSLIHKKSPNLIPGDFKAILGKAILEKVTSKKVLNQIGNSKISLKKF
jgi:hypothetical protein